MLYLAFTSRWNPKLPSYVSTRFLYITKNSFLAEVTFNLFFPYKVPLIEDSSSLRSGLPAPKCWFFFVEFGRSFHAKFSNFKEDFNIFPGNFSMDVFRIVNWQKITKYTNNKKWWKAPKHLSKCMFFKEFSNWPLKKLSLFKWSKQIDWKHMTDRKYQQYGRKTK